MNTDFISPMTTNSLNTNTDANCTLFVGDLSRFCTEDSIANIFSTIGKVVKVKIIRDQNTKAPLGYGFVKMLEAAYAKVAMAKFNNTQLYGRPLRIKWAGRHLKNDCFAQRHHASTSAGSEINSIHVRFRVLKVRY